MGRILLHFLELSTTIIEDEHSTFNDLFVDLCKSVFRNYHGSEALERGLLEVLLIGKRILEIALNLALYLIPIIL